MTGQGQLQGRNICFYLDTLTGTSGATSDQPPATQSPSRAHKFPHHLSSGFRPMPTLVSLTGGSPFTGTPREPCRVTNCTPSSSSDILCLCCPCPWIMSGEPPTGFKGYEVGGWRRLISREWSGKLQCWPSRPHWRESGLVTCDTELYSGVSTSRLLPLSQHSQQHFFFYIPQEALRPSFPANKGKRM